MRKGPRITGRGNGQGQKSSFVQLGTNNSVSNQEKILLELISQIGVGRALQLIAQQLPEEFSLMPLKMDSEEIPSTSDFSALKTYPDEFDTQETTFSNHNTFNDWNRVLAHIQQQISPPSFDTWLRNTTAELLPGNVLKVWCKNEFQCEWLIERYKETIHSSVKAVMGKPYEIQCEAFG